MSSDREDRAEKIGTEAWRLLEELLTTGQMVLKSGTVIAPKAGTLVKVIQDCAKLKPPKSRQVANLDNFRLPKTVAKAAAKNKDE